jgi:hypothetical protein
LAAFGSLTPDGGAMLARVVEAPMTRATARYWNVVSAPDGKLACGQLRADFRTRRGQYCRTEYEETRKR